MIGAAMRIVKVGVLAPTNKGIPLGVQGENRATQVEFDTRPWFREYPSGTVSAVARRYGDPAPYPLTLDVADGTAVWQVSDTDTAKAGEGAVELTMTSAGARVRSLTFKTLVTASLTDSPVDDDAWYGWLDKAVVKVDETVQSAQRKMGEVDLEWTALKADVTEKVDECGEVAALAASDAHHAKVDAQATAKALESAEGSVAKAEAAANRAVDAALAADDSAVEVSRSALSAGESAESAAGSATNAARSASEAATSASNAADAASAASGSASAAAQSATDASNAKAAAQTAKDEAATSASNAESSATAAAKSASDAAASVGAINVIAPKTVDVAASSEIDGSVAVGAGSVAKNENELSIGNDTLTREITHVSTPTALTSASNKKYTDDNDANTLSEAKKYTDDNTSNALVGTVSGKLLHVEDAWPSKPIGLTIDGAYKQDGTPSPESPAPITVIENPVVKVTGRNLIDVHDGMPESDCDKYFDKEKKRIIKPGTYVAGLTASNYVQTITISDAVFSEGGMTFSSRAGGYGVGVGVSLVPGETYVRTLTSTNAGPTVMFYSSDGTYLSYAGTQFFTVPADAAYTVMLIIPSSVNQPVSATDIFIKRKDTAGAYAPYVGASIPITLPAEHPYLAALPDGTHDEIVIDKYGNASLVARVMKTTDNDINSSTGYEEKVNREDFQINLGQFKFKYGAGLAISNVCVDGDVNKTSPVSGGVIAGRYVRMTRPETVTDIVSARKYLIDIGFVGYIALINSVTYYLGKLDIPSLPDAISNVWTDAELTTNMSMTYKRDINIAFGNLAQAVVAAAAGE